MLKKAIIIVIGMVVNISYVIAENKTEAQVFFREADKNLIGVIQGEGAQIIFEAMTAIGEISGSEGSDIGKKEGKSLSCFKKKTADGQYFYSRGFSVSREGKFIPINESEIIPASLLSTLGNQDEFSKADIYDMTSDGCGFAGGSIKGQAATMLSNFMIVPFGENITCFGGSEVTCDFLMEDEGYIFGESRVTIAGS